MLTEEQKELALKALSRLRMVKDYYADAGPNAGTMRVTLDGYLPIEEYNAMLAVRYELSREEV